MDYHLKRDKVGQDNRTFVVLQDVGGEASLISDIGGVFAVLGLDHVLQVVVDLDMCTR